MISKVEIASVNTAKLPVLSNEEKDELLKKIKDGDLLAREKFIERKFKISFKCCSEIQWERRESRRFISDRVCTDL